MLAQGAVACPAAPPAPQAIKAGACGGEGNVQGVNAAVYSRALRLVRCQAASAICYTVRTSVKRPFSECHAKVYSLPHANSAETPTFLALVVHGPGFSVCASCGQVACVTTPARARASALARCWVGAAAERALRGIWRPVATSHCVQDSTRSNVQVQVAAMVQKVFSKHSENTQSTQQCQYQQDDAAA
jgi:hypothetical protein